uniref:Uncharacterized protein n=1 Tax=Cajanus cajan TaxID=3821 RepID=A0A151S6X8_CAJCA|nr:hypothetical protein KK1_027673 [Cajanus cajan]
MATPNWSLLFPHAIVEILPSNNSDLYESLVHPVSIDEVKNAMLSMGPCKAPRPEGFQPIFYHSLWELVGHDVWELVANILPSLVETILVPIPEVDSPTSLRDFRPLVCAIDNAPIAQDFVHFMHKKQGKGGHFPFKIDFEKTYDRVDWNFLRLTIPTIVKFIISCKSSTSIALRWNNEVLESFLPHRGLHQGDSMSPYLFVLYKEKLAILIQQKVQAKKISKFKNILGFEHTKKINRFLGFPLLTRKVKKSDLSFVVDKIQSKLARRKSRLLGRAGRVTLAKVVLASVPIYVMQNLAGDISIWHDKFLADDPFSQQVDFVNIQDIQFQVCDIWRHGAWQFQNLATLLPDWIKQKINRMVLDDSCQDCIILGHAPTGYLLLQPLPLVHQCSPFW